MSKEKILSVNNLQKSFGNFKAVNDLSFSIYEGEVFGLLGPNGSGKTTTLGILLGVINQNSGTYEWFGKAPSSNLRKKIGVLIETPNFYPYLSAEDNLKIVADIKEVTHEKLDSLLDFVGLFDKKKKRFGTYSLGMKQRLGIAATLIGNPKVIILDEPTNGLDAEGIADVRELILNIAKTGTTVLLASHLLDEIQKVCTNILIIKSGTKIKEGQINEVLTQKNGIKLSLEDVYLTSLSQN